MSIYVFVGCMNSRHCRLFTRKWASGRIVYWYTPHTCMIVSVCLPGEIGVGAAGRTQGNSFTNSIFWTNNNNLNMRYKLCMCIIVMSARWFLCWRCRSYARKLSHELNLQNEEYYFNIKYNYACVFVGWTMCWHCRLCARRHYPRGDMLLHVHIYLYLHMHMHMYT